MRAFRSRTYLPGLFALLFTSTLWAAEPLQFAYYEVRGDNMSDLRKEISERGPIGRDGLRHATNTNWYVHWHFKSAGEDGACKMTSVTTKVDAMMTLPKWIKAGEVSADLAREWDEHAAALRRGADRYYDVAIAAANEIEQKLSAMSGASCKELKEEANSAASAVIEAARVKDRDDETATGMPGTGPNCAKPVYPPASLRKREHGTVNGMFLIGLDGRVIDTKLVKSSGFEELDKAALNAIARCVFRRASADVATEPTWRPITYVWSLD